jgi:hypothetical protein
MFEVGPIVGSQARCVDLRYLLGECEEYGIQVCDVYLVQTF